MRFVVRWAGLSLLLVVSSAHVGSPDAWFDGMAGPYHVTVHIEAPAVVPGIAVVNVQADSDVTRITAFVNTFDAEGGTPPPDELVAAGDRPGWKRTRLWVMNAGSNRVTIGAEGPRGAGTVVVPLAAVAQRRLAVTPVFVAMVVAFAAVLVTGILTFVGAAVREGVLEPGVAPDEDRRGRARRAMARGAVVVAVVLLGTSAWWRAEDRDFRDRMFRPLAISSRVEDSSGVARLVVMITDSTWLRRDDVQLVRVRGDASLDGLVDDHGKLMHLFLVGEDGPGMAHLHPVTRDTVSFTSTLPSLPAGPYRVFADIVHRSGFTETMTSAVRVPAVAAPVPPSDTDDSWSGGSPATGDSARLNDGSTLAWLRAGTVVAGHEAGLRFRLTRPPGDTARLEPYLGMPGHAAVVRDDGQVFIHLHPMGTISPAAQARLTPAALHPAHAASPAAPDELLHFPYAFPSPGRYTVWVQLKRRGIVQTAAFPVTVHPAQR